MEEDKNYLNLVTKHIELDKLLGSTDSKYHNKIKKLLAKRDKLRNQNGLLAGFKINKINKKLEKIQQTKKEDK